MISEDFAFEQLDRLSGLQYFPNKPAALLELARTLQQIAPTEQDAVRIVDAWLQVNPHAPTPAALLDLAASRAAKTDFWDSHERPCEACGGTGWTVLIGPVPEHLATAPSLGVVRCHCFQAKAVTA